MTAVLLPRTSRLPVGFGPRLVLIGAAVLGCYLLAPPPVPDLSAQVARAEAVRRSGLSVLWLGWFGGVHVPVYSTLTPMLMAVVGAPATGAVATLVAVAAMTRLLRNSPRPRAAAVCFLLTGLANLLGGRVTFAVGMALGLVCLLGLELRRGWVRLMAVVGTGVLVALASPLAGLFLILALLVVVAVRGPARLHALVAAVVVAAVLAATGALFPGAGVMPFHLGGFILAAGCTVIVALVCPRRSVRIGALIYLLTEIAFLLHPLAVGLNITRLAWIFALPLVVAHATLSRRSLAVAAVVVSLVPALDLAAQLGAATDASAHERFYDPLLLALAAEQQTHPGEAGQRVEIVDSRGHWAAVFVSRHYRLARGWERQADRGLNPMFYGQGSLDDSSYRRWLDQLAVGWVAVPVAPLDYASRAEAALVVANPTYLRRVWSNSDWTLYRVTDPVPFARPGAVLSSDDRAVTLTVPDLRTVSIAVRWSPYLVVTDPSGRLVGCVGDQDGWAFIRVPTPGVYRVTADFPGQLRGREARCA